MPSAVRQEIQKDELKLAALPMPPELGSKEKMEVEDAIHHSFIFGFRLVLVLCSILAVISALFACWLIEARAQEK